jgi:hypothetical protein
VTQTTDTTEDFFKRARMLAVAKKHEMQHGWKAPKSRLANPRIGSALQSALETAEQSYLLIAEEQEKLRELLVEETDPVRIKARQYQIWLVEQQLNRATELARTRLKHLRSIKHRHRSAKNRSAVRPIKSHWFEYYAWGFDPRPDAPLNTIPFSLFPFQERFIEWLDYLVFKARQSGVVPSLAIWVRPNVPFDGNFNWLFVKASKCCSYLEPRMRSIRKRT